MGRDRDFRPSRRVFLLAKPEGPAFRLDAAGQSGRGRLSASGWRPRCLPAVTETAEGRAAPARWEGAGAGSISGAGSSACVDCLWLVSGEGNAEGREQRVFPRFGLRCGDWCEMEVDAAAEYGRDGPRERRGVGEAGQQQQNHEVRPQSGTDRFSKHSYWLDLWLFILFDLVLFVFVYLLPW